MPETVTATSCPEHPLCVVKYTTVPIKDLEGRTPLSLPYEYQTWLNARGAAALEVDHIPTKLDPDGLLVGNVVIAPRDISTRLAYLDEQVDKLLDLIAETRFALDAQMSVHVLEDEDHRRRKTRLEVDRWMEQFDHDTAVHRRLDRIERFVTRSKRRVKKWEAVG